jgi:NAD+ kinase
LKYYVVNRGDEISVQLTETFHQLAKHYGMAYNEDMPDVVLSIGGDGTMLHAFHMFEDQVERISFVGIHTGHLGFYADWKPDEIEKLAHLMASRNSEMERRVVKYPIAEIHLVTTHGTEKHLVLNEFTLKGEESTLVAKVHINDEMFEMFRGDGICISTPTGSTAYNKSLGGAVIHPALETIQIAEIASINNRVFRTLGSSIILPKHHHCDIYPKENQKVVLSLDHNQIKLNDLISVRTTVSDKKVQFARFRPFPFWTRVKEAFIGKEVE